MNRLRRHHRQTGFTLLEVLIALALSAVLLQALYTAMSIAFRARQSMLRQTDLPRQTTLVLNLIEQELQGALPPTGVLAGPFVGSVTEDGAVDTLSFSAAGLLKLSTEEDASRDPGIHQVQLALSGATAPSTITLTIDRAPLNEDRSADEDADLSAQAESETLATRVQTLTLRYYDGADWQTEWDSSAQDDLLPLAVEVTLELRDPNDAQRTCRMVRVVPLTAGRVSGSGLTGGGL